MEDSSVKSAKRGLIIGHIALGLAGGAALVMFCLLAFTQADALVVWVPVVALTVVTIGSLWLLRHDDKNRDRRH